MFMKWIRLLTIHIKKNADLVTVDQDEMLALPILTNGSIIDELRTRISDNGV